MKSTEPMESRLKRVDMHNFFLNKIDDAINSQNYITASWLIYSCFENRYFRTVEKVKEQCPNCRSKSKCNKSKNNSLSLTTKIKCIQRLYDNNVSCIKKSFRYEVFQETIEWVTERNQLMHELLTLETYEDTDEMFRENALQGKALLQETYDSCTRFRKEFYDNNYTFQFPEAASQKCPCKSKEG